MSQITKLVTSFFVLLTLSAEAGEISQIKGNKALLNVAVGEVTEGSDFYAIDSMGKKKAILHVTKVKGTKAIAEILKGSAEPGQGLKPRPSQGGAPKTSTAEATTPPAQASSADATPTNDSDHNKKPRGFMGNFLYRNTAIGLMAGIAQNSMSLTGQKTENGQTYSDSLALSGNSFNLIGFYDFDLNKAFTVDIKAGIENFSTKGSTSVSPVCSDSSSCSVNFMYLAGEANIRYNYLTSHTRAWVGGGLAFLIAASKSTTVSNLDTSSATNQMILLGTGADFTLGHGSFVPVSFEYGMFPGSSSVKATTMILRAGYGWRY